MEATKAPPERKPLLEVSTLAPVRPLVTVDDVPHEFRLLQDFGSIEHAEFTRDGHRFDELWAKGSEGRRLSKSDAAMLQGVLSEALSRVFETHPDMQELGERLVAAIDWEAAAPESRAGLTKAEGHELEATLNRLFDRVLVDPRAFRDQLGDRLTGAIVREVVLTFTNAPQLMRLMQLMAQQTEDEKAGNGSITAS